jgi:hypothetical protein
MKPKRNPKKLRVERNKNREDDKHRHFALQAGRMIFEEWKRQLINTPTRFDDLPQKVNELGARLAAGVKHPDVLRAMLNIVDMKLGDVYLALKTGVLHVMVHAICPNETRHAGTIMICNNSFDTLVSRESWNNKSTRIACPACGGLIHWKSMKPVKTVVEGN